MASLFPREEHAEALFRKILSSEAAQQQLYDAFCTEQENTEGDIGSTFPQALLQAYENRDLSALLISLCGNTMFDLLRTAYLIPYRFGGKSGSNPRLLTDETGAPLDGCEISPRTLRKFADIRRQHTLPPRSALYLADGSHLRHLYDEDMQVQEIMSPPRCGILTLYALPDTAEQGLTEAEAYNIVWDAFNALQETCPTAMVFYGQDTGFKKERAYDELGVLLPMKEFEHHILHHLEQADGIALACREKMMQAAGIDSLPL